MGLWAKSLLKHHFKWEWKVCQNGEPHPHYRLSHMAFRKQLYGHTVDFLAVILTRHFVKLKKKHGTVNRKLSLVFLGSAPQKLPMEPLLDHSVICLCIYLSLHIFSETNYQKKWLFMRNPNFIFYNFKMLLQK